MFTLNIVLAVFIEGNTTYAIFNAPITLTLSTIDVPICKHNCLKYYSIYFCVVSVGRLLSINYVSFKFISELILYCFLHVLAKVAHLCMTIPISSTVHSNSASHSTVLYIYIYLNTSSL
jgi:hypothetical protein